MAATAAQAAGFTRARLPTARPARVAISATAAMAVVVRSCLRPMAASRQNGGNGGKGFPGETKIDELADLSVGDRFEITIGTGGRSGGGGRGYETGAAGVTGANGLVLFIPVYTTREGDG